VFFRPRNLEATASTHVRTVDVLARGAVPNHAIWVRKMAMNDSRRARTNGTFTAQFRGVCFPLGELWVSADRIYDRHFEGRPIAGL